MDPTAILLIGSALILAGVFGLVEVAIRYGAPPVEQTAMSADRREVAAENLAPALSPTEEDLELFVVRERGVNPDGRSREEIIRQLQIGDRVDLVPESAGGHHEVKVVARGGAIGYVPASNVPLVLDALSEAAHTRSAISQIVEDHDRRAVWINLSIWR